MSLTGTYLDYHGPLDFDILDSILLQLKNNKDYKLLNKISSKRVYSLVIECLENICKHSVPSSHKRSSSESFISVRDENDMVVIKAGNAVENGTKEDIINRIGHINDSDEALLRKLYSNIINSNKPGNDKCAGLGFIHMALLTENKIGISFKPFVNGYEYFEITLTLKKNKMRKLIIDARSNSPKVILDPDKNVFTISGESRPPDVREFYEPIIFWLKEYSLKLLKSTGNVDPLIFNFNFEYFNSSSGKSILDICKILGGLRFKGIPVAVKWYFEPGDTDMRDAGKEMASIVKFPFEFIEEERNT